jgi:hypothetical protein
MPNALPLPGYLLGLIALVKKTARCTDTDIKDTYVEVF